MNREDAYHWARAVAEAWEQQDPAQAARLFEGVTVYRETPFSENYAEESGAIEGLWDEVRGQRQVRVEVDLFAFERDAGCVRYEASYVDACGTKRHTAGIWLVRFDGLDCSEFTMYTVEGTKK